MTTKPKTDSPHKERFDILNRFSGAVAFSAEIECAPDTLPSIKLGLAIRLAVKARADLSGANLSGAYLSGANLTRADLSGANLSGANLTRAENAELAVAQTRILPEGALIGWKLCNAGILVKLRIPEDAKRSHAFGRKCRAEFVDVIEVIGADVGVSRHDNKTEYRTGARVTPDHFDDNWQAECSGGIHFFITKEEALDYA